MRLPVDSGGEVNTAEHRERVRLGVVGQAADEKDGDFVFFNAQSRSPIGPLDGCGGTEPIDIHSQRDRLQSDVDPGRPAVAVAEVRRVIVGHCSHHPDDGRGSADEGVVRLERGGDQIAELPDGLDRAERVRHTRE